MNLTRIVVFCVALVAAGAAVLLVRGMTGGGTPVAQASLPPPQLTADVLVASKDIAAGRILEPGSVRWESWPKSSVSDTLILKSAEPDIEKAVAGIVARAPFLAGQPITETSIVRAGSAGFLAATITPGMRAVSIPISAERGAGGFILPNDRVDIILTREVGDNAGRKNMLSGTILRDVRILAIDQTAQQGKDQQSAVGKTATVELSPRQSELIERARSMGQLSLALRPLGESNDDVALTGAGFGEGATTGMTVIRYGIARNNAVAEERTPQ